MVIVLFPAGVASADTVASYAVRPLAQDVWTTIGPSSLPGNFVLTKVIPQGVYGNTFSEYQSRQCDSVGVNRTPA